MKNLYIWFGEWVIWRKCQSNRQAEQSLRYWSKRVSWPLKIAK